MNAFRVGKQVAIEYDAGNNSPCYRYALKELRRLLERINVSSNLMAVSNSGVLVGLRVDNAGALGRKIRQGLSKRLSHDGYVLRVERALVSILALNDKGVLNGVYDLAERLGFAFLMPGIEGEWPPLSGQIRSLPGGEEYVNPRFPHRGIFSPGATGDYTAEEWLRYYAKLRFNAVDQNDVRLSQELGLRIEVGGHGMSDLMPRSLFAKKPELFRLSQPEDFWGKRQKDFNFCVTNPETKRIIQRNYIRKIAKMRGIYAVHAWADDLPGGGWCLCPGCRAFSPSDQALLAMKYISEAVSAEKLSMRVPVIAYHDTMFPGTSFSAPRQGFLLFAPRERCYGHALDDKQCLKNQSYLRALKAWMAKFKGMDDAHTFEYYCDQILFRGLYPFLPDVILDDMRVYQEHGIESHMVLQVGGPILAPEYNMLIFSKALWDKDYTFERFANDISARIAPDKPEIWEKYLQARRKIFQAAMCLCDHPNDIYFDYRWLPETTSAFGKKMAGVYGQAADSLASAANELTKSIPAGSSFERTRPMARREAGRAVFEAEELRVMQAQQTAMNGIGQYHDSGEIGKLRKGLKSLKDAMRLLDTAYGKGRAAGMLAGKSYYFDLNRKWLKPEFIKKMNKLKMAYRFLSRESECDNNNTGGKKHVY